ncbi:hypothetical protein U9M48_008001 [Paspalum notatum var. saurae]|uniref:Uncharacterized protein n=1 Tax=Paspalum notatum var. saurae TaxID=547442 RepID=A0AAQ3WCW3_PASNO
MTEGTPPKRLQLPSSIRLRLGTIVISRFFEICHFGSNCLGFYLSLAFKLPDSARGPGRAPKTAAARHLAVVRRVGQGGRREPGRRRCGGRRVHAGRRRCGGQCEPGRRREHVGRRQAAAAGARTWGGGAAAAGARSLGGCSAAADARVVKQHRGGAWGRGKAAAPAPMEEGSPLLLLVDPGGEAPGRGAG